MTIHPHTMRVEFPEDSVYGRLSGKKMTVAFDYLMGEVHSYEGGMVGGIFNGEALEYICRQWTGSMKKSPFFRKG